MSNKTIVFLISLCVCMPAYAQNVNDWLREADGYRQAMSSGTIDMSIELYKADKLSEQRRYRVYVKPGRRSLVVFKSADQAGQKVLLNDDQFYLFMPATRRAIRITPMQKLLGEASTGDIASMTWYEDYSAQLTNESVTIDGVPCVELELSPRRDGVTYQRITLYLHQASHHPVFARLYLKSGKLAKEAHYGLSEMNGRRMVTQMKLVDRIREQRHTQVNYLAMTAQDFPDKYFNAQFLLRNTIE